MAFIFDKHNAFDLIKDGNIIQSLMGCIGIFINILLLLWARPTKSPAFYILGILLFLVTTIISFYNNAKLKYIKTKTYDLYSIKERIENDNKDKDSLLNECVSKTDAIISEYRSLIANNRNLEDVLKGKIESCEKEHSDEMARLEHEYETKKKELEENAAMFKLNCYYEHEALRAELEETYQAKHNELKELLRNEHPFCKVAEMYNDAYLLLFGDKKPKEINVYHYKLMEYRIKVLRQVFPEIEEYIVGEDTWEIISEYLNDKRTRPEYWLSEEENRRVQSDEAAMEQLALDRYFQSSKRTKWEIGRDYEMYYGNNLYNKGYEVIYNGIEKGMLDNGIDLIARKGNVVWVIQCKNWGPKGTIYTKTVMQLYGAKEWYRREYANEGIEVKAEIVTSSFLTDEAKAIAKILGVETKEHLEIQKFPAIKCNVNSKNEKIYHLPFDRDYDRTKIINRDRGECYALTIKEASDMGFRRACITNN